MTSDNATVVAASRAAEELLGTSGLAGRRLADFVVSGSLGAVEGSMREALSLPGTPHRRTVAVHQDDGGDRRLEWVVTAAESVDAVLVELRHARQVTNSEAFFDDLTGLPGRRLSLDRLGHALARSRRDGKLVGVLFLDMDHFKDINDTHGHDTGDKALVAFGRLVGRVLRPGDTLARIGGDEFLAVLEDLGDPSELEIVAERILQALEARPISTGTASTCRPASVRPPAAGWPPPRPAWCATPTPPCTRPRSPAGAAATGSSPSTSRKPKSSMPESCAG